MDKQAVRKYLLKKRQKLNDSQRNQKSNTIIHKLLPLIKDAKNIGIYLSLDDEVNTLDFLEIFLSEFDSVSAPVVKNEDLVFYKIASRDKLKLGYKNILEPKEEVVTNKNLIDVMIVPLVGFDRRLNRIGYGKGFYDRYLKDFNQLKIGLAFDDLEYSNIPHNDNDIKLDWIITESRILK